MDDACACIPVPIDCGSAEFVDHWEKIIEQKKKNLVIICIVFFIIFEHYSNRHLLLLFVHFAEYLNIKYYLLDQSKRQLIQHYYNYSQQLNKVSR